MLRFARTLLSVVTPLLVVYLLAIPAAAMPAPAHPHRAARGTLVGEEIQFSNATYTTTEGGTSFMYSVTVSCNPAPTTTVTVTWDIVGGGTAAAGADYTDGTGTVDFLNGEGSKTFDIEILADSIDEPDETINLVLNNPQGGAVLGTQTTAVLTIQDDGDTPPSVSISVAAVSHDEDAGSPLLVVNLSGPSGHTVSIVVGTTDGTAQSPDDYLAPVSPVTFNPGATSSNIVLSIIDDFVNEAASETFTVTISSPNFATLGATTSCVVTITDDDPFPEVHFSASGSNVDEGAGDETIAVFLSAASDLTVTVDFDSVDGVALGGSDFTALSGTLTFAPGETSKNITYTILEDNFEESAEQFAIHLSGPTNATLGAVSIFTVTINANSEDVPKKKDTSNCAATSGHFAPLALLALIGLAVLARSRRRRV